MRGPLCILTPQSLKRHPYLVGEEWVLRKREYELEAMGLLVLHNVLSLRKKPNDFHVALTNQGFGDIEWGEAFVGDIVAVRTYLNVLQVVKDLEVLVLDHLGSRVALEKHSGPELRNTLDAGCRCETPGKCMDAWQTQPCTFMHLHACMHSARTHGNMVTHRPPQARPP